MSKINEATKAMLNNLAYAQQNRTAFDLLIMRMQRFNRINDSDRFSNAVSIINEHLSNNLISAWHDLSMMAPVSKEAMEYLKGRTKSWFERDDSDIMYYLGCHGSYYTKDREKFKEEVMKFFTEG